MGYPLSVICVECKTEYYLGYGGGSWSDRMIFRFPIEEHGGHELIRHCDDFTRVIDGDLYSDGAGWIDDTLILKDYKSFKHISLEDQPFIMVRNVESIQ
jgi:hypothetical protein